MDYKRLYKIRLGKQMKRALLFISEADGWHCFSRDRDTIEPIERLARHNLVIISYNYRMYRITDRGYTLAQHLKEKNVKEKRKRH